MEVKEQLEKLGQEIDAKIKQGNEQAVNAAKETGKLVGDDLKNELTNMLAKHQELTQTQLDEMQTSFKKSGGIYGNQKESLTEMLSKGVSENINNIRSKSTFELDLDLKAVGDMLNSANLGAGVIQPSVNAGIINRQAYFNHVRDFLTVRPTTSPVIGYVRENGGEGAFATVAEGALKPQVDYDLTYLTANVQKIAGHVRISEEMIQDVPYITNYITTRGVEDLRLVEDSQILYGDGTGTNLRGITLDASTFARPAGMGTVTGATNVDVLRAAMAQIRVGRYAASAIMLNPIDVAVLEMSKDSTGQALIAAPTAYNPVRTLYGIPVIESDSITAGSFLIGDFRNGAELYDRQALNVRFYDQDRDNAIRNMVTIVIEERIGLATIRPASFVKGTFAAAKTALTAA